MDILEIMNCISITVFLCFNVQYAIPCSKECIFIQTKVIHSQSGNFLCFLYLKHAKFDYLSYLFYIL